MDVTEAEDRDISKSMHTFEAAVSARRRELVAPQPKRILLALDGSNQDGQSEALVQEIARRTGASTVRLELGGKPKEERPHSYERILEEAKREKAELIVVCAPFREDFSELGHESVGTNLDILMSRSTLPLLVAREPKADPASCFDRVLVAMNLYREESPEAAAWGLALVSEGGSIRVLATADRESIRAASVLLDAEEEWRELDSETLAGLRRPEAAGLIGVLQRSASERSLGCRISARVGDAVKEVTGLSNEEEGLLVLSCPTDPGTAAYQEVQGMVRMSRNPVLVV